MGGVAVDDVEEGGLTISVVLDLEALLGEFGNKLLDALGLVDLDKTGAAAPGVLVCLGDLLGSGSALSILSFSGLRVEEVEIDIGRREVAQVGLVLDCLLYTSDAADE